MSFKVKACFLPIGFLFFFVQHIQGQDQKVADSLKKIYQKGIFDDTARLSLLRELAFNESNDLKLGLQYAEELINIAQQTNNFLYLYQGYFQKGSIKRLNGDLQEALDAFLKGNQAARKANSLLGEGNTYGAIADIYAVSKNHKSAMLYYHKAIAILRQSNDSVALASNILNAGDAFRNNKNYDSALIYFRESEILFEQVKYFTGKAYSLGNIGMVYAHTGQTNLAEKNIREAIRLLEQNEDYYPICVYLISMADIYIEKGDRQKAMEYARRSLQLARQYGLKEQISDANLKLSELSEKLGNINESFNYYKNHIAYRDSVNNIKSVQSMAEMRADFEVSQKQVEIDLLNQQKHNQQIVVAATTIGLILLFLLAAGLYRRNKYIQKTKLIIEKEKARSDHLLLNILPAETAQELKENGKVMAKRFESVTVLFTDFKGFTQFAETLPPEKLVETIDYYFSRFDKIIDKYDLEKIKTVGDAYMCAGGLPFPSVDHAQRMVNAAFEMADFVHQSNLKLAADSACLEIRIGINTGPVVAGVVGSRKFSYDIWGDTVNIASRMESSSEPGRINISGNTYEIIKDEFECQYRGEIDVKSKGMMEMYYVVAPVKKTVD